MLHAFTLLSCLACLLHENWHLNDLTIDELMFEINDDIYLDMLTVILIFRKRTHEIIGPEEEKRDNLAPNVRLEER
jgi:hypothetical protein